MAQLNNFRSKVNIGACQIVIRVFFLLQIAPGRQTLAFSRCWSIAQVVALEGSIAHMPRSGTRLCWLAQHDFRFHSKHGIRLHIALAGK